MGRAGAIEAEVVVDRIGLIEAIAALRAELTSAMEQARDEELTFPIEGIQVELHVGVTRGDSAYGGLRFWVVELGADAQVVHEQVQRVTVTFGAPRRDGKPIDVALDMESRP